jgi:hypothetical protein
MVTTRWRLDATDPVIQQHVIKGHTVLPFAVWLNRCFAAVADAQSFAPCALTRLVVARPLIFTAGGAVNAQFVGWPDGASGRFEVREEAGSTGPSSSAVPFIEGGWQNATDDGWLAWRGCAGPLLTHEAFYDTASRAGFGYGPQLRRIARLQSEQQSWAAELAPIQDPEPSLERESAWDALLQSGAVLASADAGRCVIPFAIDRARLAPASGEGPIARLCGEWVADATDSAARVANICGFGSSTSPRLELRGVRYRIVDQLPIAQPHATAASSPPALDDVRADSILMTLRSAPPEHRPLLLVRFIEDQLMEILQWNRSRRSELAAGFAAVGVDSLSSLDLQYRLQTALGFALPLGESFNYPSATELAGALLRKHITLDHH